MAQNGGNHYTSVSRESLSLDDNTAHPESIPLSPSHHDDHHQNGSSTTPNVNTNTNGNTPHRSGTTRTHINPLHMHMHMPNVNTANITRLWDRFRGKGRNIPGVWQSIKNIATCSSLNILLLLIPVAWTAHYSYRIPHKGSHNEWPETLIFVLNFLAIIPLENLFDYGGEQMSMYVGKDLGDLIIITLNNAVEATLAIVLLIKCELKLLQATIAGVILLHLLLIPGTAFIIGGARTTEQSLHPHHTELNHALLSIGVLSVLVPTAIFAALNGGANQLPAAVATASGLPATEPVSSITGGEGGGSTTEHAARAVARHIVRALTGEVTVEVTKGVPGGLTTTNIVSDTSRATFLAMSRGIAILLLLVYIMSRVFFHNPPGENNAGHVHPDAPEELKHVEKKLAEEDPEVNVWVCIVMLAIAITLMAITAEFLVESLEFVKEEQRVQEEWFGLILLPFVSFAADGAVAIIFFFKYIIGRSPPPPKSLAKARAIDLSIQFGLFWMPFLVLLAWWTSRPLMLLFDLYEVAVLLGSCFLVNYITADAKTNWAEGAIMVAFYIIIALCTWFYQGQPVLHAFLQCGASVAQALAGGAEHGEGGGGGH